MRKLISVKSLTTVALRGRRSTSDAPMGSRPAAGPPLEQSPSAPAVPARTGVVADTWPDSARSPPSDKSARAFGSAAARSEVDHRSEESSRYAQRQPPGDHAKHFPS